MGGCAGGWVRGVLRVDWPARSPVTVRVMNDQSRIEPGLPKKRPHSGLVLGLAQHNPNPPHHVAGGDADADEDAALSLVALAWAAPAEGPAQAHGCDAASLQEPPPFIQRLQAPRLAP